MLPEVPKEVPLGTRQVEEERSWRRPKIEKRDAEKFGLTPGCPGCIAASRGAPGRNHTESCRKRMEEGMTQANDERINRYSQRIVEAAERMMPKTEGEHEEGKKRRTHEEQQEADQTAENSAAADQQMQESAAGSQDPNGSQHRGKKRSEQITRGRETRAMEEIIQGGKDDRRKER